MLKWFLRKIFKVFLVLLKIGLCLVIYCFVGSFFVFDDKDGGVDG